MPSADTQKMDSNNISKPTRPYTEYNIFFQLEREYILQVLLGVKPTLSPSDVFDSEDGIYQGPPLPSRYNSLVLPDDWYVPGKERRRKRRHRKSHGKIGFHELSLKIADAWSKVDGETRTFCACLSDIGMLAYKSAMRKFKLSQPAKSQSPSPSASNDSVSDGPEVVQSKGDLSAQKELPRVVSCDMGLPLTMIPKQKQTDIYNDKESTEGMECKLEDEVDLYLSFFRKEEMNQPRRSVDSFVDMDDDEIMGIWTSAEGAPCADVVQSTSCFEKDNAFGVMYCHDVCDSKPLFACKYPENDFGELDKMRYFLRQQQEQLRRVTRRSFVACSA